MQSEKKVADGRICFFFKRVWKCPNTEVVSQAKSLHASLDSINHLHAHFLTVLIKMIKKQDNGVVACCVIVFCPTYELDNKEVKSNRLSDDCHSSIYRNKNCDLVLSYHDTP